MVGPITWEMTMSDAVSKAAVLAAIDGYWESIGGGIPEGPSGEAIIDTLDALSSTIRALPAVSAPDVAELMEALTKAAYAQGVAHARLSVSSHADWNPSTVRDDLLLNIDHTCTGFFRAIEATTEPTP
jgi:hypothetical protein